MSTFIVTEHIVGGGAAVAAYFHNGSTITPIGSLPAAALEPDVVHNVASGTNMAVNRAWVVLDALFILQDGIIYKSTDEGVTFAAVHTLAGTSVNDTASFVGPVAVMVLGALKYIGFYERTANIGVYIYDVATDAWTDADIGIVHRFGLGNSIPVEHKGLVWARGGTGGGFHQFFSYDPVNGSSSLVALNTPSQGGTVQLISWDGDLWAGVTADSGVANVHKLVGSSWSPFALGFTFLSTTCMNCMFIDPSTNNLIVIFWEGGGTVGRCVELTPAGAATDLSGTVFGAAFNALFAFGGAPFGRVWPHYERLPGGGYTVHIYATRGRLTSDPVERFTWVDIATQIVELGIVGGNATFAFPYGVAGGGDHLFFAGERRVLQTAEVGNATGIEVTAEAFRSTGGTLSVRGHHHKVGDPGAPPLAAMTIENPGGGGGGLALSGANPGSQIDNVPANRTPFTFDWRQDSDGFTTGDNFVYQLEGL